MMYWLFLPLFPFGILESLNPRNWGILLLRMVLVSDKHMMTLGGAVAGEGLAPWWVSMAPGTARQIHMSLELQLAMSGSRLPYPGGWA